MGAARPSIRVLGLGLEWELLGHLLGLGLGLEWELLGHLLGLEWELCDQEGGHVTYTYPMCIYI